VNTECVRGKFTESELESAIIKLFEAQDYTHVLGENIHRKFEDILIEDDLREYPSWHYKDLTDTETAKIISRLQNIPATPLYAGNKEAFRLVNEGFDLQRDDSKKVAVHINYIDFENPEDNRFRIVSQYSVQGERLRRPDLLMFINGIPMVIFEFKSAIKEDTTIHDAWEQITIRYCRDIPKLMRYCFVSVISDGANTRMGTIFTPYEYYYAWNKINDNEKVGNGITALLTMIKGAFAKDRIIEILRDFIYYPDGSAKETAIIARYPQFFAAKKMYESVKAHLKPNGDGKGGTYFGATGCGKTYAMLFLARMLGQRDRDFFKNPTVVIITDREDLDRQASELFVSSKEYLHDKNVRSIESRNDLRSALGTQSNALLLEIGKGDAPLMLKD
jgi:type I restriction enzyme, R subunit